MMATVRVKFLRGTSVGAGIDAYPGDVMDIDARLFAVFSQQGRVVAVQESAAAPAEPAPEPEKPVRKGRKNA